MLLVCVPVRWTCQRVIQMDQTPARDVNDPILKEVLFFKKKELFTVPLMMMIIALKSSLSKNINKK